MDGFYHAAQRALQDRFDTRRLADRLEAVKVHRELTADDRAFIESVDMFFLATADAAGRPECSYKGGDRGFVRALDATTVVFPSYDGNGMFLSLGNIMENPNVGILFVDFARPRRMRLNGTAELSYDPALCALFEGAQLVVRVQVREVFPNCPRYIHRMTRVEASPYVPRAGSVPPVPDWKRADWARDVLPEGDPARGAQTS